MRRIARFTLTFLLLFSTLMMKVQADSVLPHDVESSEKAGEGTLLSGTIIGTRTSVDYSTGSVSVSVNKREEAFDGDLNTFFASYERSKTWVGLDLGVPHVITRVGWAPRNESTYGPKRVQLALFEGANQADFMDAVPLHLVEEQSATGQMHYANVFVSRGFRYVRYVGPNDARCNVAEVEFYGYEGAGDDSRFYQLTNLPTLSIHTEGNVDPYDKVNEIPSSVTVIYADGRLAQEEKASTRLRGNASLYFDKKPYRIKFDDKVRMLKGSPLASPAKAKKWTLISNHGDKTLMRNMVGQEMSRRLGMAYTPWIEPVDVIVNGEYKGCYQLTDQITVNPDRVDITEMTAQDLEGEALAGGYLIECDAYAGSEPPNRRFYSRQGIPVTIKSPDANTITPSQREYIQGYFNLLEQRVYADDYQDPERGYASLLDVESFLQHFLVNEFAGNSDTYWSTYMYKDRDEVVFHVGPCWDFDDAMDNDKRTYPVSGKSDFIFRHIGIYAGTLPQITNRILSDPKAWDMLCRMWADKRESGVFSEKSMLAYVDSVAQVLDASQRLNFIRWDVLNSLVHLNFQALGSYEAELRTLRDYLKLRIRWLDVHLGYAEQPSEDNSFLISSADDFIAFATAVNAGQFGLNAVLTEDIDLSGYGFISVGTQGGMYLGTFDGQGHSITLDFNCHQINAALFQYLGGTVENLITRGRIQTNAKFAAGVVARCYGGTVRNCVSYVDLVSSVSGDGTHGGIVAVTDGGGTIENCLVAGSMYGTNTSHCGGIVGWASTTTRISSCILASSLRLNPEGGHTICRNYSQVISTNNFYRNALGETGNASRIATSAYLKDGSICYRINGGKTDGTQAWYQNLDNGLEADPTPVPFNTHGTVYALSRTYTNHDPTGVFAVDNEEKSPSQWFDLLGRKAEKPKKNAPASSFKGNVILWK